MDESAGYIKKCDCPAVQKQFKAWCDGDFYSVKKGGAAGMVFVWTEGEDVPPKMYSPTWLPRQDQIQFMLRRHYAQKTGSKRPHDWFPKGDIGLGVVLQRFCMWTTENQVMANNMESFEQLWLAFYMWEKHTMVWAKEKWTK